MNPALVVTDVNEPCNSREQMWLNFVQVIKDLNELYIDGNKVCASCDGCEWILLSRVNEPMVSLPYVSKMNNFLSPCMYMTLTLTIKHE